MILQALAGYYQRLASEGGTDLATEGFERKEIPFLIILDSNGRFLDLQDTRQGEGKQKRGRIFTVPKGVKKTSGIAANLLWDTPNYVLGRPKPPKPDAKKNAAQLLALAKEQHECFVNTMQEKMTVAAHDEGVRAVMEFIRNGDFASLFHHPAWQEIEQSGPNITFKMDRDDGLVCQRPAVVTALSGRGTAEKSSHQGVCLITGNMDAPVRLHTAIKGVRGAQTSGANIVSFNLDAFASYGKEQGLNAPVGKKAEFAYTTALNHLLARDSRQRIQVGDATTVFWAEKKNAMEDAFFEIFGRQPDKGEQEQDYKSLIALFRSPQSGAKAELDPGTRFYVLGLSPNAARIAVRFWYAGTVSDVAEHIGQHFDDLEMVKGRSEWHRIGLTWLLRSTALQEKDDNIAPNLAGDTMKAILSGTPYPQTLLASAIRRCRAEQEITYTRAALIKAILVRETRYHKRSEKEVGMSLDTSNTNPGYLLGRLFAVLERTQESANPGINATIRDRFYGAASGTPVTAYPLLMKLKNHHISKLENRGQAVNLERLIGEIIGKLDASDAFPARLSLQDQGRFAVGYYHQRQDFFTKKSD